MPPAKQEPAKITGGNQNACVSTVYLGTTEDPNNIFQQPAESVVGVALGATAFPQPHRGMPITLSKTSATLTIAGDVLQAGVDTTPPLIHDGMQVPSTLTLVMAASNTKEVTHTFTVKSTATIHVANGLAQPLKVTVPLPNTVWHPKSNLVDVTFAEKSMKISSTINILGGVLAVFTCKPAPTLLLSPTIVHEGTATTTPTTQPSTVTVAGATTTTVSSAGDASTTSGSLPRTGASWVLLLVMAAAAIDVGIVMIGATRRRFRHR